MAYIAAAYPPRTTPEHRCGHLVSCSLVLTRFVHMESCQGLSRCLLPLEYHDISPSGAAALCAEPPCAPHPLAASAKRWMSCTCIFSYWGGRSRRWPYNTSRPAPPSLGQMCSNSPNTARAYNGMNRASASEPQKTCERVILLSPRQGWQGFEGNKPRKREEEAWGLQHWQHRSGTWSLMMEIISRQPPTKSKDVLFSPR